MSTPENQHPAKAHFVGQMERLKPGHLTKLSTALLLEVFQSESEAVEWFKTLGVTLDPYWKECGLPLATVMRPNTEAKGPRGGPA